MTLCEAFCATLREGFCVMLYDELYVTLHEAFCATLREGFCVIYIRDCCHAM